MPLTRLADVITRAANPLAAGIVRLAQESLQDTAGEPAPNAA